MKSESDKFAERRIASQTFARYPFGSSVVLRFGYAIILVNKEIGFCTRFSGDGVSQAKLLNKTHTEEPN